MKIDPAIVQIFAESVRAEVMVRPAPVKLTLVGNHVRCASVRGSTSPQPDPEVK